MKMIALLLLLLSLLFLVVDSKELLQNTNTNTNTNTNSNTNKRIAVIGGGFSALSAACELSLLGYNVTIYEKNNFIGGRAHQFHTDEGFIFDAGPSWYWMPEVFDKLFNRYSKGTKSVSDFYNLTRLEPAYRVVFDRNDFVDVPGNLDGILQLSESYQSGSSKKLSEMFDEAGEKYQASMSEWIWKPFVSFTELIDLNLIKSVFQFDMFSGFVNHLKKFDVVNDRMLTILKWPVIFIGESPDHAASLYSMMTYAGHALGTYYPLDNSNSGSGMSSPAIALSKIAVDTLGVKIKLNSEITKIKFNEFDAATHVCHNDECFEVDGIVASADYHHVEQNLFPQHLRRYDDKYWERQILSPSCMLFYLGFNKTIDGLLHHTFFFDSDLDKHLQNTFVDHIHSDQPTFYVSATSKTDPSVAPSNSENVFVLVPLSYRLNGTDTKEFRNQVLQIVLQRMELKLQEKIIGSLIYRKDYGPSDFEKEFYSFRGNAFGHANTLLQSLNFKPAMDSLATNVVFAGHLTNPGPGVPTALVSGSVAANLLHSKLTSFYYTTFLTIIEGIFNIVFLIIALHLFILFVFILPSERHRSYLLCCKLLFEHGRTYFAASTLLGIVQFLDTAAMYALFRVADDYVDNYESSTQRAKDLDEFIEKFWKCWNSGKGDYNLHPTLPAIIETSIRRGYDKHFFEIFFRSMKIDGDKSVLCKTLKDTEYYMEGSAAIIGEFMIPILMSESTQAEKNAALPHARDLGNAFQITNMIRDINEDLDLNRQYMPEDICKKHGVNLKLRDATQVGFKPFMNEMFDYADKLYDSADIGIQMLPISVRDVIKVARIAYHRIHHKIKSKENYNIFDGRVKVPFSEKLAMIVNTVPFLSLVQIIAAEFYARFIHFLYDPPIIVMLMGLLWTRMIEFPNCSYLVYHFIFTLPLLSLLSIYHYYHKSVAGGSPALSRHVKLGFYFTLMLCLIATIYTTPWDNYLVYRGVWGYGEESRVIGLLWFVPYEEYAFFSIQTMMTGAVWLLCFPNPNDLTLPTHKLAGITRYLQFWKNVGSLAFCLIFIFGLFCLSVQGHLTYLGLILSWATPVLLIQWIIGGHIIVYFAGKVITCIFTLSIYLCATDQWAISNGIWDIQAQHSVPQLLLNLPFEEALFFFIATTMCCFGLTLAMVVMRYKQIMNQNGVSIGVIASIFAVAEWGVYENINNNNNSNLVSHIKNE